MAKHVTLVAGDIDDETIAWFKAHGATVEGFGLVTITLPEQAQVHRGTRGWDFSVSFYNAEGNDEDSYANIELNIDAYETQIRVEYNGDRQCTCKGRGCALCVEELAAIERGENPYAHHIKIPAFTVGDLVHITAGYYAGRDAQIAGRVYEDPADHRLVCLVRLLGEKGASVVAAVADIEPGEAQPHRARQQRPQRPEDSHEHINDLSGRNQEVAWEMAQEAAQASDAQIEAEADLAREDKSINWNELPPLNRPF